MTGWLPACWLPVAAMLRSNTHPGADGADGALQAGKLSRRSALGVASRLPLSLAPSGEVGPHCSELHDG